MSEPIRRTIPVAEMMNRLARKERDLKNAGAYAEAAGVRDALTVILRMADEEETPLDPTGDTE